MISATLASPDCPVPPAASGLVRCERVGATPSPDVDMPASKVMSIWRSVMPTRDEVRKAQRRLHAKALATFGLVVTSYWCLVLSDLPAVVRLGAAGLLVTALVTVGTSIMHDANHGSFSVIDG